jgi:hypothetical protein
MARGMPPTSLPTYLLSSSPTYPPTYLLTPHRPPSPSPSPSPSPRPRPQAPVPTSSPTYLLTYIPSHPTVRSPHHTSHATRLARCRGGCRHQTSDIRHHYHSLGQTQTRHRHGHRHSVRFPRLAAQRLRRVVSCRVVRRSGLYLSLSLCRLVSSQVSALPKLLNEYTHTHASTAQHSTARHDTTQHGSCTPGRPAGRSVLPSPKYLPTCMPRWTSTYSTAAVWRKLGIRGSSGSAGIQVAVPH